MQEKQESEAAARAASAAGAGSGADLGPEHGPQHEPTAQASSPPLSAASIIVSMAMMAIGNGLLFAFLPVKLSAEGFPPWVAGAILTGMSAGGLAGCFLAGTVIRRVGHARAFAAFAAVIVVANVAIAWRTDATLWIAARVVYGFAITGLFIVSQSWLNHAAENAWRGRVIAVFYMSYVLSIGAGGYLISLISLDGAEAPLLAILFIGLGILPVALTRLETPPPPEAVAVAIRRVWRMSPVGLAGLSVVGGLTMLVQGFAPIYAAAEGMSQREIGLLLALMQGGMLLVQLPLGWISDRTDRRYVLIAACLIVALGALTAMQVPVGAFILVVAVFAIWSGATESIYSVATAHANDRAEPGDYISVSSTLLVAWSVSGTVFPAVATALTPVLGPRAFMGIAALVALAYAVFVLWRLRVREAVPEAEQGAYQQISAQAPLTPELSALAGAEDEGEASDGARPRPASVTAPRGGGSPAL